MSTYHHGNLRQALIAEGVKLIEESGVSSLTLREIGERAGVSRTAPYRHFSDKNQLLDAISEAGFTEFADALEAASAQAEPNFRARLEAMGEAYLKFAEDRRPYYEVMFGVRHSDGPAGERAFDALEGLIKSGQQSGDVRPGDSADIAKVVWSLVHGIVMLRLKWDFNVAWNVLRFGL